MCWTFLENSHFFLTTSYVKDVYEYIFAHDCMCLYVGNTSFVTQIFLVVTPRAILSLPFREFVEAGAGVADSPRERDGGH